VTEPLEWQAASVEPFDPPTVRAVYDTVANEYAAAFAEDLNRLPVDRAVLDEFVANLGREGPVLDLGCGPGQVGQYVALRGVEVIGVDLSMQMLGTARARFPRTGVVCGDMRQLPTRSHSCSGVIAFYSIQHLRRAHLDLGLAEFRRVLAVGGGLLIATHLGEGEVFMDEFLGHQVATVGGTLFQDPELREALERHSFTIEDVRLRDSLPHEHSSRRIYLRALSGGA
jgi:ubiquinone/menaquinone biosynthesis C-methylase UbiE